MLASVLGNIEDMQLLLANRANPNIAEMVLPANILNAVLIYCFYFGISICYIDCDYSNPA